MGIHDFTKIMKASKQITYADIADKNCAVDAYVELFRSSSMQHAAGLVNKSGEATLHLNVAFTNAVRRKQLGCSDVWCWDSRDPRASTDSKQHVLAERAEVRRTNRDEMARVQAELVRHQDMRQKISPQQLLQIDPGFERTMRDMQQQLLQLQSRNPSAQHFSSMISNVQYMLSKLGVRMAMAPVGCDAEKLAAQLCREKLVDAVITVDTDVMVYGAPCQIKKIPGKSGQYDMYVLHECLQQHGITPQQLAEVASAMGCDFCKKTAGVGAKTVVPRVLAGSITYTPEQVAAQQRFMDRTPVVYELVESTCTNASLDELMDFMVAEQGFSMTRVVKALTPFYV